MSEMHYEQLPDPSQLQGLAGMWYAQELDLQSLSAAVTTAFSSVQWTGENAAVFAAIASDVAQVLNSAAAGCKQVGDNINLLISNVGQLQKGEEAQMILGIVETVLTVVLLIPGVGELLDFAVTEGLQGILKSIATVFGVAEFDFGAASQFLINLFGRGVLGTALNAAFSFGLPAFSDLVVGLQPQFDTTSLILFGVFEGVGWLGAGIGAFDEAGLKDLVPPNEKPFYNAFGTLTNIYRAEGAPNPRGIAMTTLTDAGGGPGRLVPDAVTELINTKLETLYTLSPGAYDKYFGRLSPGDWRPLPLPGDKASVPPGGEEGLGTAADLTPEIQRFFTDPARLEFFRLLPPAKDSPAAEHFARYLDSGQLADLKGAGSDYLRGLYAESTRQRADWGLSGETGLPDDGLPLDPVDARYIASRYPGVLDQFSRISPPAAQAKVLTDWLHGSGLGERLPSRAGTPDGAQDAFAKTKVTEPDSASAAAHDVMPDVSAAISKSEPAGTVIAQAGPRDTVAAVTAPPSGPRDAPPAIPRPALQKDPGQPREFDVGGTRWTSDQGSYRAGGDAYGGDLPPVTVPAGSRAVFDDTGAIQHLVLRDGPSYTRDPTGGWSVPRIKPGSLPLKTIAGPRTLTGKDGRPVLTLLPGKHDVAMDNGVPVAYRQGSAWFFPDGNGGWAEHGSRDPAAVEAWLAGENKASPEAIQHLWDIAARNRSQLAPQERLSGLSDAALAEMLHKGSFSDALAAAYQKMLSTGKAPRWTQVEAVLKLRDGHDNMDTGEGKTLLFTMAAALKTRDAPVVHFATRAAGLAKEAFSEFKKVLEPLGIDVHEMNPDVMPPPPKDQRPAVYVGTYKDLGFGFLKNRHKGSGLLYGQRPGHSLHAELLGDEGDEALYTRQQYFIQDKPRQLASPKTAAAIRDATNFLTKHLGAPDGLTEAHFGRTPGQRGDTAALTKEGLVKATELGAATLGKGWARRLNLAATARLAYRFKTHYEIDSDAGFKIVPIDRFTGEPLQDPGTGLEQRWFDVGSYLEALHNLPIRDDPGGSLRTSNQELFTLPAYGGGQRVHFASGTMKGTEPLLEEHGMATDVAVVPRYYEKQLTELPDHVSGTTQAEMEQITHDVLLRWNAGEGGPVLIVPHDNAWTAELASRLHDAGVPADHIQALDAKWAIKQGAELGSAFEKSMGNAGQRGMITITRMANRGTDIKVDPDIPGGLHVIGTDHDIPFAEIQFKNRTARSGAEGSAQIYFALDGDFISGARDPGLASAITAYTRASQDLSQPRPDLTEAHLALAQAQLATARKQLLGLIPSIQAQAAVRLGIQVPAQAPAGLSPERPRGVSGLGAETLAVIPAHYGWFTVAVHFDPETDRVLLGGQWRTAAQLAKLLPALDGWQQALAETTVGAPQVILLSCGAAVTPGPASSFAAELASRLGGRVFAATAEVVIPADSSQITVSGEWLLHHGDGTVDGGYGSDLHQAIGAWTRASAGTPGLVITPPPATHPTISLGNAASSASEAEIITGGPRSPGYGELANSLARAAGQPSADPRFLAVLARRIGLHNQDGNPLAYAQGVVTPSVRRLTALLELAAASYGPATITEPALTAFRQFHDLSRARLAVVRGPGASRRPLTLADLHDEYRALYDWPADATVTPAQLRDLIAFIPRVKQQGTALDHDHLATAIFFAVKDDAGTAAGTPGQPGAPSLHAAWPAGAGLPAVVTPRVVSATLVSPAATAGEPVVIGVAWDASASVPAGQPVEHLHAPITVDKAAHTRIGGALGDLATPLATGSAIVIKADGITLPGARPDLPPPTHVIVAAVPVIRNGQPDSRLLRAVYLATRDAASQAGAQAIAIDPFAPAPGRHAATALRESYNALAALACRDSPPSAQQPPPLAVPRVMVVGATLGEQQETSAYWAGRDRIGTQLDAGQPAPPEGTPVESGAADWRQLLAAYRYLAAGYPRWRSVLAGARAHHPGGRAQIAAALNHLDEDYLRLQRAFGLITPRDSGDHPAPAARDHLRYAIDQVHDVLDTLSAHVDVPWDGTRPRADPPDSLQARARKSLGADVGRFTASQLIRAMILADRLAHAQQGGPAGLGFLTGLAQDAGALHGGRPSLAALFALLDMAAQIFGDTSVGLTDLASLRALGALTGDRIGAGAARDVVTMEQLDAVARAVYRLHPSAPVGPFIRRDLVTLVQAAQRARDRGPGGEVTRDDLVGILDAAGQRLSRVLSYWAGAPGGDLATPAQKRELLSGILTGPAPWADQQAVMLTLMASDDTELADLLGAGLNAGSPRASLAQAIPLDSPLRAQLNWFFAHRFTRAPGAGLAYVAGQPAHPFDPAALRPELAAIDQDTPLTSHQAAGIAAAIYWLGADQVTDLIRPLAGPKRNRVTRRLTLIRNLADSPGRAAWLGSTLPVVDSVLSRLYAMAVADIPSAAALRNFSLSPTPQQAQLINAVLFPGASGGAVPHGGETFTQVLPGQAETFDAKISRALSEELTAAESRYVTGKGEAEHGTPGILFSKSHIGLILDQAKKATDRVLGHLGTGPALRQDEDGANGAPGQRHNVHDSFTDRLAEQKSMTDQQRAERARHIASWLLNGSPAITGILQEHHANPDYGGPNRAPNEQGRIINGIIHGLVADEHTRGLLLAIDRGRPGTAFGGEMWIQYFRSPSGDPKNDQEYLWHLLWVAIHEYIHLTEHAWARTVRALLGEHANNFLPEAITCLLTDIVASTLDVTSPRLRAVIEGGHAALPPLTPQEMPRPTRYNFHNGVFDLVAALGLGPLLTWHFTGDGRPLVTALAMDYMAISGAPVAPAGHQLAPHVTVTDWDRRVDSDLFTARYQRGLLKVNPGFWPGADSYSFNCVTTGKRTDAWLATGEEDLEPAAPTGPQSIASLIEWAGRLPQVADSYEEAERLVTEGGPGTRGFLVFTVDGDPYAHVVNVVNDDTPGLGVLYLDGQAGTLARLPAAPQRLALILTRAPATERTFPAGHIMLATDDWPLAGVDPAPVPGPSMTQPPQASTSLQPRSSSPRAAAPWERLEIPPQEVRNDRPVTGYLVVRGTPSVLRQQLVRDPFEAGDTARPQHLRLTRSLPRLPGDARDAQLLVEVRVGTGAAVNPFQTARAATAAGEPLPEGWPDPETLPGQLWLPRESLGQAHIVTVYRPSAFGWTPVKGAGLAGLSLDVSPQVGSAGLETFDWQRLHGAGGISPLRPREHEGLSSLPDGDAVFEIRLPGRPPQTSPLPWAGNRVYYVDVHASEWRTRPYLAAVGAQVSVGGAHLADMVLASEDFQRAYRRDPHLSVVLLSRAVAWPGHGDVASSFARRAAERLDGQVAVWATSSQVTTSDDGSSLVITSPGAADGQWWARFDGAGDTGGRAVLRLPDHVRGVSLRKAADARFTMPLVLPGAEGADWPGNLFVLDAMRSGSKVRAFADGAYEDLNAADLAARLPGFGWQDQPVLLLVDNSAPLARALALALRTEVIYPVGWVGQQPAPSAGPAPGAGLPAAGTLLVAPHDRSQPHPRWLKAAWDGTASAPSGPGAAPSGSAEPVTAYLVWRGPLRRLPPGAGGNVRLLLRRPRPAGSWRGQHLIEVHVSLQAAMAAYRTGDEAGAERPHRAWGTPETLPGHLLLPAEDLAQARIVKVYRPHISGWIAAPDAGLAGLPLAAGVDLGSGGIEVFHWAALNGKPGISLMPPSERNDLTRLRDDPDARFRIGPDDGAPGRPLPWAGQPVFYIDVAADEGGARLRLATDGQSVVTSGDHLAELALASEPFTQAYSEHGQHLNVVLLSPVAGSGQVAESFAAHAAELGKPVTVWGASGRVDLPGTGPDGTLVVCPAAGGDGLWTRYEGTGGPDGRAVLRLPDHVRGVSLRKAADARFTMPLVLPGAEAADWPGNPFVLDVMRKGPAAPTPAAAIEDPAPKVRAFANGAYEDWGAAELAAMLPELGWQHGQPVLLLADIGIALARALADAAGAEVIYPGGWLEQQAPGSHVPGTPEPGTLLIQPRLGFAQGPRPRWFRLRPAGAPGPGTRQPPAHLSRQQRLSASDTIVGLTDDLQAWATVEELLKPRFGEAWPAVAEVLRPAFDTSMVKSLLTYLTRGGTWRIAVNLVAMRATVTLDARLDGESEHLDDVPNYEFENGSESQAGTGSFEEWSRRLIVGLPVKVQSPGDQVEYGATAGAYWEATSQRRADSGARTVAKAKTVETGSIFAAAVSIGVTVELSGIGTADGPRRQTAPVRVKIAVPQADCPGQPPVTGHRAAPERIRRDHRFGSTDVILDVFPLPWPDGTGGGLDDALSGLGDAGRRIYGPAGWEKALAELTEAITLNSLHQEMKGITSGQPMTVTLESADGWADVTARVVQLEHVRPTPQTEFYTGSEVQRRTPEQTIYTRAWQFPLGGQLLGDADHFEPQGSGTGQAGRDRFYVRDTLTRSGMATKSKTTGQIFKGQVELILDLHKNSSDRAERGAIRLGVRAVVEHAETTSAPDHADTVWNVPDHAAPGSEAAPGDGAAGPTALPDLVYVPPARIWDKTAGHGLRDTDVVRDLWKIGDLRAALDRHGPRFFGRDSWRRIRTRLFAAYHRDQIITHLGSMTRATPLLGPHLPQRGLPADSMIQARAEITEMRFRRVDSAAELAPQGERSSQLGRRTLRWKIAQGLAGPGGSGDAGQWTLAGGLEFGRQHRRRVGTRAGIGGKTVTNAKFPVPMAVFDTQVRLHVQITGAGPAQVFTVDLPAELAIPAAECGPLNDSWKNGHTSAGLPVTRADYAALTHGPDGDVTDGGALLPAPGPDAKLRPPQRLRNGRLGMSDFVLSLYPDGDALYGEVSSDLRAYLGRRGWRRAAPRARNALSMPALKPAIPPMTAGDEAVIPVSGNGWLGHVRVTAELTGPEHVGTSQKVEFDTGTESVRVTGASEENSRRSVIQGVFHAKAPAPHLSVSGAVTKNIDSTVGVTTESGGRTIARGKSPEPGALFAATTVFHVTYDIRGPGGIWFPVRSRTVAIPSLAVVPARDCEPVMPAAASGGAPAAPETGVPAFITRDGTFASSVIVQDVWVDPPQPGQRRQGMADVLRARPAAVQTAAPAPALGVLDGPVRGEPGKTPVVSGPVTVKPGQPNVFTHGAQSIEDVARRVYGRHWNTLRDKILSDVTMNRVHQEMRPMSFGQPIVVTTLAGRARVHITSSAVPDGWRRTGGTAATEFNTGTERSAQFSVFDNSADFSKSQSTAIQFQLLGTTDPIGASPAALHAGPTAAGQRGGDKVRNVSGSGKAAMTTKTKAAGSAATGSAWLHFRFEFDPAPGFGPQRVAIASAAVGVSITAEARESGPGARPGPGQMLMPPDRIWNASLGGLTDTDVIRALPSSGGIHQALEIEGRAVFGTKAWQDLGPVAAAAISNEQLSAGLPAMTHGGAHVSPLGIHWPGITDGQVTATAQLLYMEHVRTDDKAELNPVNETTQQMSDADQHWRAGQLQFQLGAQVGIPGGTEATVDASLGAQYRRRAGVLSLSTGRVVDNGKFRWPTAVFWSLVRVDITLRSGAARRTITAVIPAEIGIPVSDCATAPAGSDGTYRAPGEDAPIHSPEAQPQAWQELPAGANDPCLEAVQAFLAMLPPDVLALLSAGQVIATPSGPRPLMTATPSGLGASDAALSDLAGNPGAAGAAQAGRPSWLRRSGNVRGPRILRGRPVTHSPAQIAGITATPDGADLTAARGLLQLAAESDERARLATQIDEVAESLRAGSAPEAALPSAQDLLAAAVRMASARRRPWAIVFGLLSEAIGRTDGPGSRQPGALPHKLAALSQLLEERDRTPEEARAAARTLLVFDETVTDVVHEAAQFLSAQLQGWRQRRDRISGLAGAAWRLKLAGRVPDLAADLEQAVRHVQEAEALASSTLPSAEPPTSSGLHVAAPGSADSADAVTAYLEPLTAIAEAVNRAWPVWDALERTARQVAERAAIEDITAPVSPGGQNTNEAAGQDTSSPAMLLPAIPPPASQTAATLDTVRAELMARLQDMLPSNQAAGFADRLGEALDTLVLTDPAPSASFVFRWTEGLRENAMHAQVKGSHAQEPAQPGRLTVTASITRSSMQLGYLGPTAADNGATEEVRQVSVTVDLAGPQQEVAEADRRSRETPPAAGGRPRVGGEPEQQGIAADPGRTRAEVAAAVERQRLERERAQQRSRAEQTAATVQQWQEEHDEASRQLREAEPEEARRQHNWNRAETVRNDLRAGWDKMAQYRRKKADDAQAQREASRQETLRRDAERARAFDRAQTIRGKIEAGWRPREQVQHAQDRHAEAAPTTRHPLLEQRVQPASHHQELSVTDISAGHAPATRLEAARPFVLHVSQDQSIVVGRSQPPWQSGEGRHVLVLTAHSADGGGLRLEEDGPTLSYEEFAAQVRDSPDFAGLDDSAEIVLASCKAAVPGTDGISPAEHVARALGVRVWATTGHIGAIGHDEAGFILTPDEHGNHAQWSRFSQDGEPEPFSHEVTEPTQADHAFDISRVSYMAPRGGGKGKRGAAPAGSSASSAGPVSRTVRTKEKKTTRPEPVQDEVPRDGYSILSSIIVSDPRAVRDFIDAQLGAPADRAAEDLRAWLSDTSGVRRAMLSGGPLTGEAGYARGRLIEALKFYIKGHTDDCWEPLQGLALPRGVPDTHPTRRDHLADLVGAWDGAHAGRFITVAADALNRVVHTDVFEHPPLGGTDKATNWEETVSPHSVGTDRVPVINVVRSTRGVGLAHYNPVASRRPLAASIQVAPLNGNVTLKADEVHVIEISLDKERAMTQFHPDQKSHTVAWELVRLAMMARSGQTAYDLLASFVEEQKAFLASPPQFDKRKVDVSWRWDDITRRLLDLSDLDRHRSLSEWQRLVSEQVSAHIELSQLAGFASHNGKPGGHNEAGLLKILRDFEEKLKLARKDGAKEPAPPSTDVALGLLDMPTIVGLNDFDRNRARAHLLSSLHHVAPDYMKFEDSMGHTTQANVLESLLFGPDGKPGDVDVHTPRPTMSTRRDPAQEPVGHSDIGGHLVADVSLSDDRTIKRIALSNDRLPTKFKWVNGSQGSHTVSWNLQRASVFSFEDHPAKELREWLVQWHGLMSDSVKKTSATEADDRATILEATFVKVESELDGAPPYREQALLSEMIRLLMAMHNLIPEASFNDTLMLGVAASSGEKDLPITTSEHFRQRMNAETLASQFDGAAPYNADLSDDELTRALKLWKLMAERLGDVNEDTIRALADRAYTPKILTELKKAANQNRMAAFYSANYLRGFAKWHLALNKLAVELEVAHPGKNFSRVVKAAWNEAKEEFGVHLTTETLDMGGADPAKVAELDNHLKNLLLADDPNEVSADIEELVKHFQPAGPIAKKRRLGPVAAGAT
jgi:hypothetical protein